MTNKTLSKALLTLACLSAGGLLLATGFGAFSIKHHPSEIHKELTPFPVQAKEDPKPDNSTSTTILLEPITITGGTHMLTAPRVQKQKPCHLRYRVIGFKDDKFQDFRGVFYCEP